MSNHYYVYAYLREDGSPYYIGKGKDNRIDDKHGHPTLPVKERRVKLCVDLTSNDALIKEKELIAFYGRKDNNTGILRNGNDGGFGGDTSIHIDYQKVQATRKKTLLEKYGVENYFCVPWVVEKRDKSLRSEQTKSNRKKSMLSAKGVENAFQLTETKEAIAEMKKSRGERLIVKKIRLYHSLGFKSLFSKPGWYQIKDENVLSQKLKEYEEKYGKIETLSSNDIPKI